jgi:hypothetical protein
MARRGKEMPASGDRCDDDEQADCARDERSGELARLAELVDSVHWILLRYAQLRAVALTVEKLDAHRGDLVPRERAGIDPGAVTVTCDGVVPG